jgi:predicted RNA-binding Zn-ribbon protein involved in translation (DUF1610 family)
MEKITSPKAFSENDDRIRQMYAKVVAPNCGQIKKGFIKCPECGEEILITPTLRKMNEAIENHVLLHKEERESNLLEKYTIPINIRLALAKQILYKF